MSTLFSTIILLIYIPTNNVELFSFLHGFAYFILSYLNSIRWYLLMDFISISVILIDVEHLPIHLLFVCLLAEYICLVLLLIFIGICGVLLWVIKVVNNLQLFFPFCTLSLNSLDYFLWYEKLFIWRNLIYLYLGFFFCACESNPKTAYISYYIETCPLCFVPVVSTFKS